MKPRRYVCIHGHFYQPPRENPWLELLESQPSAWPARDWNERVSDECYGPNAAAKTLDANGQIRRIASNYERLSFNFGPTLLSWMETAQPELYQAILDADRTSAAFFDGHGSAIAQVYNHMILPLANHRDKVTQVRWGIRDFEHRFGRTPEGMWLAETAVDTSSLEVLAAEGILFTILAPHQCREVKAPGQGWCSVDGQRVDPRRGYRVPLPSGRSITVFFYDGPASRAVAFERLLDDGHRFAARLLGLLDERDEPQLAHIATDGETYGHHHAYGEMALAVALDELGGREDVELSNYAAFLARHPPTWEARIHDDSSWSCAHGIERWRSDCGCNSGTGWHQRWRAPLRAALDELREALAAAFERACDPYLDDPWGARDAYIELILNRERAAVDRFFERWARAPLSPSGRRTVLTALEAQRHAMLMYTSCGWFFDEISGLETVQVLRYAARALDLARETVDENAALRFARSLAQAPSNREEYRDGSGVFEKLVSPSAVTTSAVGAHVAVLGSLPESSGTIRIGSFHGELLDQDLRRVGRARLAFGRVRVVSEVTEEEANLGYALLHFGDHNILGGVRPFTGAAEHVDAHEALVAAFSHADLTQVVRELEARFRGAVFSLRDLRPDVQAAALAPLLASQTKVAEEAYDTLYDASAPLMSFLGSLGQPAPSVFQTAAQHSLMGRLRSALAAGEALQLHRVEALVTEARRAGIALDPIALGAALQRSLERVVIATLESPPDDERLAQLRELASFVERCPWRMDLSRAQHLVWHRGRETLRTLAGSAPPQAEALQRAAAHLGVRLDG